jgi:CBS domain-containing protein
MNDRERTELFAVLRRRKPFDRMSEEHVRWLVAHMQLVEFPANTPVLSPGITCDALYFIQKGLIQLEAMGNAADDKKILAELVEGESFPLEALEEHRPVFSTFRAKKDTVCYRLTLQDFDELEGKSKVFAEFCKYRAASFLEQSRRVYRLHFSHQSEEQQRLSTPLSVLMRPDPLTAGPWETVRDVLTGMHSRDTDAAVIVGNDNRPIGIFTMRDLLRNVVVPGSDLDLPIEKAMTASPRTLPVTALGYEAALAMAEVGLHHIIMVDEGRLAGIVTERELFNLQRVSLSQINSEIHTADSLDWLKRCCGDIQLLAENMLVQGVTPDQITQIISTLNDQVVCRTLDLELKGEKLDGIKVAWISLGSEGRFEQTFSTDQDNGIIFEAPGGTDPEAVRARLLPIAQRVNKALDEVGFPLCKGNIMAGNPDCCLSFIEWQQKFTAWIMEPSPEALLNATIFFDFRHLYGDTNLSDRLRLWLAETAQGQKRFFHLLADNALQRTPPLGFFRDFVVDDHEEHPNTIDIKLNGVTMFVDAARVYALANGVTRGNTKQRLIMAGDAHKWPQSEVNAWADAFSFLQSLRIRHQFELQRSGAKSHNRLNPYELNNLDRKFFLESLRQAGKLQKQLSSDFLMQGGM